MEAFQINTRRGFPASPVAHGMRLLAPCLVHFRSRFRRVHEFSEIRHFLATGPQPRCAGNPPEHRKSDTLRPALAYRALSLKNIAPIASVPSLASPALHIVGLLVVVVAGAAGWAAISLSVPISKSSLCCLSVFCHGAFLNRSGELML